MIISIDEIELPQPVKQHTKLATSTTPDYSTYNETHNRTVTFQTVMKEFGILFEQLQSFNPGMTMPAETDLSSSKPDGVVYLKEGARDRHIESIRVMFLN